MHDPVLFIYVLVDARFDLLPAVVENKLRNNAKCQAEKIREGLGFFLFFLFCKECPAAVLQLPATVTRSAVPIDQIPGK